MEQSIYAALFSVTLTFCRVKGEAIVEGLAVERKG